MIDSNSLPVPPKGTHWEKRDFVIGGETWCVVRDGLRGAIVARAPRDETERDSMLTVLAACADATRAIRNEPSDSDLLDAILDAFTSVDCEPEDVNAALDRAVDERARR